MRLILTSDGDEPAARHTAADLLEGALRARDPFRPDGRSTIGYSARWIRSALGLGAFGVHRDAEVTTWDLATVLQGRNTRNGHQVLPADGVAPESPGGPPRFASMVIEIPVPGALAREHGDATPERRAEIERTAIDVAESALEYARRTVPVVRTLFVDDVDMRSVNTMHVATGLPAVAIVRTPDEYGGLRVEAVVVGAERSVGKIGTPDGEAMVELEAVAASAGLERAAGQAPAAERSGEPSVPRLVGRGSAWVADPLDAWRPRLGEELAAQLDDRATLYGESLVDRDDRELETQLAKLEPLIVPPDAEQAVAARVAEEERRRVNWARLRIEEDWRLIELRRRPGAIGREAKVNAENAIDTLRARETEVFRLEDAARERYADAAYYLRGWMVDEGSRAAQWIAVTRELAIRDRERQLGMNSEAAALDLQARQPLPGARQVGVGDVSRLLAGLEAERVSRDYIWVRGALDGTRDLLPPKMLTHITIASREVQSWLRHQPEDWVRARHAELGRPDETLDRGGAREDRRIQAQRAPLQERLREFEHRIMEAGGRTWVDEGGDRELIEADGLSAPEVMEYNAHALKLRKLDVQLDSVRADGRHAGAWFTDVDHIVLATAYADEVAIRDELAMRHEVELNVVAPGEHIVELVGPPREGAEWKQIERGWKAIVRKVEYERLSSQAAAEKGRPHEAWQGGRPQEYVDDRIDALREARGMEPLSQPEIATDRPGLER